FEAEGGSDRCMTPSDLVSLLEARGIRLQEIDGRIRCTGPLGALTPQLREALATLKPDVLAILSTRNAESGAVENEAGGSLSQADVLDASGIPWAKWKATDLNRLFQEQGVTGAPGKITEATVRHGEEYWSVTRSRLVRSRQGDLTSNVA